MQRNAEIGFFTELSKIIPQDGAGIWFVPTAHPSAHSEMWVGGCNAGDGPKDKQDVALFFAGALIPGTPYTPSHVIGEDGQ